MSDQKYKLLYKKFLDNQSTPEEIELLRGYFAKYGNISLLDDVSENFDNLTPLSKKDSSEVWDNIYQTISNERYPLKLYKRIILAASIILCFGLGLYFYQVDLALNNNRFLVFENIENKIIQTRLSDGTIVYLKPNSKIYQLNNSSNIRKFQLEGEAFFDVFKDQESKFVLTLKDGTSILVLGTRFNVRSFENSSQIVLTEGRLNAKFHDKSSVLVPGEKLFINDESFEVSKVDTLIYSSWINNELYFHNELLENVIEKISKYYPSIRIKINLQLDNLYFTGYLPTNDWEACQDIILRTYKNIKHN